MSDLDVLLEAIKGSPQDDLPRLAYADCLEEAGGGGARSRALFIRTQIRMEELRKHCSCGSCVAGRGGGQHANGPCVLQRSDNRDLRVAEKVALDDAGGFLAWTAELREALGQKHVYDLDVKYRTRPCPVGVRFRRGFIDSVKAPVRLLVDLGREAVLRCPIVLLTACDREPHHFTDGVGQAPQKFHWAWQEESATRPARTYHLPKRLSPYLFGYAPRCDVPRGSMPGPGDVSYRVDPESLLHRWYRSEADASAHLHAALLALARDRAPEALHLTE